MTGQYFGSPVPDSEPDRLAGINPVTPPRRVALVRSRSSSLPEAADLNHSKLPPHLVGTKKSVLKSIDYSLSSPGFVEPNETFQEHEDTFDFGSPPSPNTRFVELKNDITALREENYRLYLQITKLEQQNAELGGLANDKDGALTVWKQHAEDMATELNHARAQAVIFRELQLGLISVETFAECRAIIMGGKAQIRAAYQTQAEAQIATLEKEIEDLREQLERARNPNKA